MAAAAVLLAIRHELEQPMHLQALKWLTYFHNETRLKLISLTTKPSGHYMYRQFNIHNSTFSPHSVFMCFVWISEQTAIISLYNINWLVFITETEFVYCAIRAGVFIHNSVNFRPYNALDYCQQYVTAASTAVKQHTYRNIAPTDTI